MDTLSRCKWPTTYSFIYIENYANRIMIYQIEYFDRPM